MLYKRVLETICCVGRCIQMYLSYSQYFLPNLMDMGSLLGAILGTILDYKRTLMSTFKGPLIRLILTIAHMGT